MKKFNSNLVHLNQRFYKIENRMTLYTGKRFQLSRRRSCKSIIINHHYRFIINMTIFADEINDKNTFWIPFHYHSGKLNV